MNSPGTDPIDKNEWSPENDDFASSGDAANTAGARRIGKPRGGFPNSLRNEFRGSYAVFRNAGDHFMQVALCTAIPRDFHSGTLFQPLFLPGGSENLCDLLHDLLMGNPW